MTDERLSRGFDRRVAALVVPRFELSACLRSDPELRGLPLVVVEKEGLRSPVVAVSPEASARGARRGMRLAEARVLAGDFVVRITPRGAIDSAMEALLDLAASFSPRVEAGDLGRAYLGVDGLEALFDTESHLVTMITARADRVGFSDLRAGIASTKIAARLAADLEHGALPSDREASILSSLPLSRLDVSRELARTFRRWGLRSIGDFVRLSERSIASRLGPEGLSLWRRIQGRGRESLHPRQSPERFEETVDCEYGVGALEPLRFLLRGALERLLTRLEIRGLRAGDLHLTLHLEGRGIDERRIRAAAPTLEGKVLLTLLRVNLESRPPRAPIERITLVVTPEHPRPIELDLFSPRGPAPEQLDAAVARLGSFVEDGRIGCAIPADSHRPGELSVKPFDGTKRRALPSPSATSLFVPLAIRAFRPPIALRVEMHCGRPEIVSCDPTTSPRTLGGRVVRCSGLWRLQGAWWSDRPFARDDYDVELTDGCLYRIHRDHETNQWFADGVYD